MLQRLTECAARHERNLDRIVGARDSARLLRILRKIMSELAMLMGVDAVIPVRQLSARARRSRCRRSRRTLPG